MPDVIGQLKIRPVPTKSVLNNSEVYISPFQEVALHKDLTLGKMCEFSPVQRRTAGPNVKNPPKM